MLVSFLMVKKKLGYLIEINFCMQKKMCCFIWLQFSLKDSLERKKLAGLTENISQPIASY